RIEVARGGSPAADAQPHQELPSVRNEVTIPASCAAGIATSRSRPDPNERPSVRYGTATRLARSSNEYQTRGEHHGRRPHCPAQHDKRRFASESAGNRQIKRRARYGSDNARP